MIYQPTPVGRRINQPTRLLGVFTDPVSEGGTVIPLEMHIHPVQVSDDTPIEAEVEAAVRNLQPFKAGKHTQLCEEHL